MTFEPNLTTGGILTSFNHIQVYLLLGAMILTFGLLSAAVMLLRRRIDPQLLWFSLFAGIYGLHLILDYQLLWWLGLRPELFRRFVIALELLVPLPTFYFFRSLELLGRFGRLLAATVSSIAVCLAMATLIFGAQFRIPNHVFLTIAILVFVIAFIRSPSNLAESKILRPGLLVFIGCALYDHITGIVGHYYLDIEPFGFLVLIVCLGIVVGRRELTQQQALVLIKQELEIARQIQFSILPATQPNPDNFRVVARYVPMTSVAGDFYDFILPDGQHAGILVADVSGHGVPAALIASMVKLAVAAQVGNASQPAELLRGMNKSLCGNTQGQFVTAAYVYLDAVSDALHYAAAAHPAMLLLRDDDVIKIIENGLMLGAFSFATYDMVSHPIFPGDRLVLYTDGIFEATDVSGEEFGEHRLATFLKETSRMDQDRVADLLIERIQRWSASQNDDLTVLICDYKRISGDVPSCA